MLIFSCFSGKTASNNFNAWLTEPRSVGRLLKKIIIYRLPIILIPQKHRHQIIQNIYIIYIHIYNKVVANNIPIKRIFKYRMCIFRRQLASNKDKRASRPLDCIIYGIISLLVFLVPSCVWLVAGACLRLNIWKNYSYVT